MRNCDDCIHKAVCYRYSYGLPENYADKCGDYESSRCKGRWIEETKRECVFSIKGEDCECREYGNEIYLHCSNCGWKTGSQANDFNYCPSCGAKMVDPQESGDKERIKAIPSAEPNMTWVTGADGAKIAFKDVPAWKVIKICEILGEPQESEDKQ